MEEDLEIVIEKKVKPLVDDAVHKFLGVDIPKISSDITDRLKRSPLLDFDVNTGISFKKAKRLFKRQYAIRLLQMHNANISAIAKIADIDRRSIHRLVKELKVDIGKIKKELPKPDYIRETAVKEVIGDALDSYKEIIKPKKLEEVYKNISVLSKDILKELPFREMTLKEAEKEFEKGFIRKALEENSSNVTKAAKAIGLRTETLFRKIKKIGIQ